MLNIRIVPVMSIAAVAVVLTGAGAMAQVIMSGPPVMMSAPPVILGAPVIVTDPAGQPVMLLAGLRPPHEYMRHARTFAHTKAAFRTSKRVAARKPARPVKFASMTHHPVLPAQPTDPPAQAVAMPENPSPPQQAALSEATPSDAAPAADNAAPATDAAVLATQAAPSAVPAPSAVAAPSADAAPSAVATPSAVVVDGQTVDVAAPDQANAIDLAADEHHDSAVSDNRTNPDPPAQRVLAVLKDASSVGSASWIAQVLAAFGGAVAAGVVAWFLIGRGHRLTYG
jgi:hypothetical protein